MIEVSATKQNLDREVTCLIDLGDTLQDATEKFGEEVVFSNFQAQAKIRAQAIMRDMLSDGKTDEEIAAFMAGWKPGTARERVVDAEKIVVAKFGNMSVEEQQDFLAKLMGLKKGEQTE